MKILMNLNNVPTDQTNKLADQASQQKLHCLIF